MSLIPYSHLFCIPTCFAERDSSLVKDIPYLVVRMMIPLERCIPRLYSELHLLSLKVPVRDRERAPWFSAGSVLRLCRICLPLSLACQSCSHKFNGLITQPLLELYELQHRGMHSQGERILRNSFNLRSFQVDAEEEPVEWRGGLWRPDQRAGQV